MCTPAIIISIVIMRMQINTATYLQTVCLVENIRTSYDDLLSLASSTRGDIRHALLLLQCWAQTGAAGHHKMLAPVYLLTDDEKSTNKNVASVEPIIPAAPVESKQSKPDSRGVLLHNGDSEEEFAQVRSNKRRRLHHQRIASSDEESQSPAVVVVDDCSQDSYSQTACEFDVSEADNRTVALSADQAPPVHRLAVESIGGCNARYGLVVSNSLFIF